MDRSVSLSAQGYNYNMGSMSSTPPKTSQACLPKSLPRSPRRSPNSYEGSSPRPSASIAGNDHTPSASTSSDQPNFFERIKLENFLYNSANEDEEKKWDRVEKILTADPQLMVCAISIHYRAGQDYKSVIFVIFDPH